LKINIIGLSIFKILVVKSKVEIDMISDHEKDPFRELKTGFNRPIFRQKIEPTSSQVILTLGI